MKKRYGLIKSFEIDHGQLDSVTKQQCFVLGYELATIDQQLKTNQKITKPVNADNRERIANACRDAGRDFSLTWHPDDASEAWLMLEVPAVENC